MCLELSFTDDPARLAARPAHRRLLAALHDRGLLLAAGPWADDSGAFLVFDTDEDGVDAIMAADPYHTMSGVRVVSIRSWNLVFAPAPAAP